MTTDSNIITIWTHSDKPTTERRIDLREVPDSTKDRIIRAAMIVAAAAGMCRISPDEGDANAANALDELAQSVAALEQCCNVTQVTEH